MYFWRIEKLKQGLAAGPLPTIEQFKYLLALTILIGLAAIPFERNNSFDVLSGIIGVPIMGLGTYYVYRLNGGASGERLLDRYMSLGWVVFIRFIVLLLLPTIIVLIVAYELFAEIPEETGLTEVVVMVLLSVVYYYVLGRHFRDLKEHAT
jgi:hypothetical protein